MNNAFYFILHFHHEFFGYVGKRLHKKPKVNFEVYDATNWNANSYDKRIA